MQRRKLLMYTILLKSECFLRTLFKHLLYMIYPQNKITFQADIKKVNTKIMFFVYPFRCFKKQARS